MKALSILGTASNAGKTWITTALCAWLRSQGVRVAPFKAQNMSNNAWAAMEGGEMARAQAIQAEACGLRPHVAMNPILLKPTGPQGSQVVLMGNAQEHCAAGEYYRHTERLWRIVTGALDHWRDRCDVLVLEGAGSPVELNLMDRDLSNLRPVHYLDGKWLLVGDIDRGGIYAQLAGTWALLQPADRDRCLGAIVNRFRGDLNLFPDPQQWLAPYAPGLRVLGTVPFAPELRPDEEDGLTEADADRGAGPTIAWLRYPHAANLTDCQPWWDDTGVRTRWTSDPTVLANAAAIVLPGSKNTIGDLRWLRERGLDSAIIGAARNGTPVFGICGGYQILGERLSDPAGVAGDAGVERGLGLLPLTTTFHPEKIVREVTAGCDSQNWTAYEIHMGRSQPSVHDFEPLGEMRLPDGKTAPHGMIRGSVSGTYLHGWFESPAARSRFTATAGIGSHYAGPRLWAEKRQAIYEAMGQHLAESIDLDPVRRHLGL